MLKDYRQKLKTLIRIDLALQLVLKGGKKYFFASIVLQLIQGVLPLLSLYLLKLIVDTTIEGMQSSTPEVYFKQVFFYIVFAAGMALAMSLIQNLGTLVKTIQGERLRDIVQVEIQKKSIELDLSYYEKSDHLDAMYRAQFEGGQRPLAIVNRVTGLVKDSVSFMAILGLLMSYSLWTSILLFAAALPAVFVNLTYADRLFQLGRRKTANERRADYINFMLTRKRYAKEVRLYQIGSYFIEKFKSLRKALLTDKINLTRKKVFAGFAAELLTTLALFSVFGLIVYRTIHGLITIGDMVMYFQAFQRGLTHLKQILNSLSGIYEDNLFMANLVDFFNQQSFVVDMQNPKPVDDLHKGDIVFEQVCFAYEDNTNVLENINFKIKPGEIVALVGLNGSGKTTLAKLLCRLYDPIHGRILISGNDLRNLKLNEWRNKINAIFQDFVQYPFSIRENIWIGDINRPLQDQEIVNVSKALGIYDIANQLSKGMDTPLGRIFSGNTELSKGQWQKIALARSLLRDSQLIILDEPSSALDALAEEAIFSRFQKLLKGRTALLISHRFSTVRFADRIMVLKNKRIIESGNHDELMALDGEYKKMYQVQATRLLFNKPY